MNWRHRRAPADVERGPADWLIPRQAAARNVRCREQRRRNARFPMVGAEIARRDAASRWSPARQQRRPIRPRPLLTGTGCCSLLALPIPSGHAYGRWLLYSRTALPRAHSHRGGGCGQAHTRPVGRSLDKRPVYAELTTFRARIVAAADQASRRIGAALHDGDQKSLSPSAEACGGEAAVAARRVRRADRDRAVTRGDRRAGGGDCARPRWNQPGSWRGGLSTRRQDSPAAPDPVDVRYAPEGGAGSRSRSGIYVRREARTNDSQARARLGSPRRGRGRRRKSCAVAVCADGAGGAALVTAWPGRPSKDAWRRSMAGSFRQPVRAGTAEGRVPLTATRQRRAPPASIRHELPAARRVSRQWGGLRQVFNNPAGPRPSRRRESGGPYRALGGGARRPHP